jgi:hypothetical protein
LLRCVDNLCLDVPHTYGKWFPTFSQSVLGPPFADKTVVAVIGRRSGFALDTRTSNRTGLLLWAERRTVLKGKKGSGLAKFYQPLFSATILRSCVWRKMSRVWRKSRFLELSIGRCAAAGGA